MENVTELNPRRGRRESVSLEEIDAAINELKAQREGRLPSGEAVYERVGLRGRTRCFERVKYWHDLREAKRLNNPSQLPEVVLETLELVMFRMEQDANDRIESELINKELELVSLRQKDAELHKRLCAEVYQREDLEKEFAVTQAENDRLLKLNQELRELNEQYQAQTLGFQKLAEDRGIELAESRSTRLQLEQALERHRKTVAELQDENRGVKVDLAQEQSRFREAANQANAQNLVQEQQANAWGNKAQKYEQTIAELQARASLTDLERATHQRQLQGLQDQLASLVRTLETRPEMTPESMQSLLRQELKALATPSDADIAWRRAYAQVMQEILDQSSVGTHVFGTSSAAVSRILAHEGTEQDLYAVIAQMQIVRAGNMRKVGEAYPTVEAFKIRARVFLLQPPEPK